MNIKTVKEWFLKSSLTVSILLALTLSVMYVFFSKGVSEKWMLNIAKRAYYEKIELTTNLLREVENLHISCTSFEKDSLFNGFIIKAVEEIDKQYGIYARVIDLDGRQLSSAFVAEGEEGGLAVLLDADDYDFATDLGFVRDEPFGDRHIVSKNGVKIHLHWIRYPVTEQHYYYILLGIVYDRVIDTIDYRALEAGQTVIIVLLLLCMFFIVYLLNKNYRLKHGNNVTND